MSPESRPDGPQQEPADHGRLLELMRRFLAEASQLYEADRLPPPATEIRIASPADVYALLAPEMEGLPQEQLRILTLNRRNHVISSPVIYQGTNAGIHIRPAEVYRPAILDSASGLIVAHNHPSGDPSPSPEDMAITRDLDATGRLLEIELLDHVIIGRGRYVSFRERGLGFGR